VILDQFAVELLTPQPRTAVAVRQRIDEARRQIGRVGKRADPRQLRAGVGDPAAPATASSSQAGAENYQGGALLQARLHCRPHRCPFRCDGRHLLAMPRHCLRDAAPK